MDIHVLEPMPFLPLYLLLLVSEEEQFRAQKMFAGKQGFVCKEGLNGGRGPFDGWRLKISHFDV